MNATAPAASGPAQAPATFAPAYPLRMTFGLPLSRQRVRIRDASRRLAVEMLIHLARPAWCGVWLGERSGEPHFVIEAERFYTQSKSYRILEREGEFGALEYDHNVSVFESTFRLFRPGEARHAFAIGQTPAGLLGQVFPGYVVSSPEGVPVMQMRLIDILAFRRAGIRLSGSRVHVRDEILCLLGLSVASISELTRRWARSG